MPKISLSNAAGALLALLACRNFFFSHPSHGLLVTSDGAARAVSLTRASDLLQMGHVDAACDCAKFQAFARSRRGGRVPSGCARARRRQVVSGLHRCASDGAARSVSLARASDLLQMGHVDAACVCAKCQACARSRRGGRVPSGCARARWRQVVSGPHRCASDGAARSVSLARASDLLQVGQVDSVYITQFLLGPPACFCAFSYSSFYVRSTSIFVSSFVRSMSSVALAAALARACSRSSRFCSCTSCHATYLRYRSSVRALSSSIRFFW